MTGSQCYTVDDTIHLSFAETCTAMRCNKFSLQVVVVLSLLAVLFAGLTAFTHNLLVVQRGNSFDFYPHYVAAQALLRGDNPYSQEVTAQIQIGMFGGELPPEFDQQRFSYPAYTALLLLPFTPLDSHTAIALWMSIQLFAIEASLLLWIHILEWKTPLVMLPVLLGALLLAFRYPINVYILGQFTGVMLLLLSLAALAFKRKHDTAAGVLLALSANPPTIAAGIAIFILLAHALKGRWRGLVSFILTLAVLVVIVVLRVGWWIPQFLGNIGDYSRYADPVWVLSMLPLWVVIPLLSLCLWAAFTTLRRAREPFHTALHTDGIALSIIAALVLLPQTGNYYLTLLIVPLLLIAKRSLTNLDAKQVLILIGCLFAVFSPWLIWLTFENYRPVEAALLPIFLFLLWWAQLQPPVSRRVAAAGKQR